jgi:hypothetical protein
MDTNITLCLQPYTMSSNIEIKHGYIQQPDTNEVQQAPLPKEIPRQTLCFGRPPLEENLILRNIKMVSSLYYGRTQKRENHITMFFHNTRKRTF